MTRAPSFVPPPASLTSPEVICKARASAESVSATVTRVDGAVLPSVDVRWVVALYWPLSVCGEAEKRLFLASFAEILLSYCQDFHIVKTP